MIYYIAILLLVLSTIFIGVASVSYFLGLYRKLKLRKAAKKYYWAVGFNHRYIDDKKKKD